MTKEEVIKIVNENAVPVFPLQIEYQDWLTAMDIVSEVLEKQIPKKPNYVSELDDNGNAIVECKCFAAQEVAIKRIKQVYCWKCGQLLDLSNED